MYLHLPRRSARREPPPGGGDPQQGLCGTALCSRCAASRPRNSPGGYIPARLADKAMLEGHEFGGDGVRRLGLPEVYIRPTGLCILVSLEGGGRTPQHL